jgi:hypothetical protein
MKKQLLTFTLLSFLIFKSYAQVLFEKGYYINNSNERIECLIKNYDWKNNPTYFEFKLAQNASIEKAVIQNTKEFGIYDVSKFIRASINIDRSNSSLNKFDSKESPNFNQEQLFLKIIIEGKGSLFFYEDENLTRFFFSVNESEIEQLIYKEYLLDNKITQNNRFKLQLYEALKCSIMSTNDFKNINYNGKDLSKLFIKYNNCVDSKYVSFESKKKIKIYLIYQ